MVWKIALTVLAAVFTVGSGSLVGAPQDVDVNDEGVQNAINASIVQYNQGLNDLYLRQVAEVIKVQRQVTGGISYILTLKLARTNCRKDRVTEDCAIHNDAEKAQAYQCVFTVFTRVWLNEITVTKMKCD